MRPTIKYRWLLAAGLTSVLLTASTVLPDHGSGSRSMMRGQGGTPRTVDLFGQNEVPPVETSGFGFGNFRLNSGQKRISLDLFAAATAPITRIHIHEGMADANGPVVVTFFDTVTDPGLDPIEVGEDGVVLNFMAINLDRDLVKDIRKHPDQYYLNVHTEAAPGGEIRGQLYKPNKRFAWLSGINAVPPNDSMGFGFADTRLNKRAGIVSLFLNIVDTFPITRVHIHEGMAGETGPIVITFFEGMDDPITVGDRAVLGFQAEGVDEDLIEDILDFPEAYYVNLHTTEYPGGEIRGQLYYGDDDDDMDDMDDDMDDMDDMDDDDMD